MTNKEALAAAISLTGIDGLLLEKSLLDASVISAEVYTAVNKKAIELVAIEVLKSMLAAATVSEGGYSVSYDVQAIKARIVYLSLVNGVDCTYLQPTVNGASRW